MFVISYNPGFCKTTDENSCPINFQSADNFQLHGLWPQNYNGTYPSYCNDHFKSLSYKEITSNLNLCNIAPWYCYQNGANFEYEVHGTCIPDMSPEEYLKLKINLYNNFMKKYGQQLRLLFKKDKIDVSEFKSEFPNLCVDIDPTTNIIVNIYQCLDKSYNPIPCPNNICSNNEYFLVPKNRSINYQYQSSYNKYNDIIFLSSTVTPQRTPN